MKLQLPAITWFLCCISALLPGTAHSQQQHVGLSDVIATVERSFSAGNRGTALISDVSTNFFQRTTLGRDQREMRAEGQMFFRTATATSPLKFRFDYLRPTRQEVVSDGRWLWIYHPENREVILSDVSFLFNQIESRGGDRAVNFLHGLGRISKDFQINFASGRTDAKGNYVLELTPRQSLMTVQRILMVVNRDSVVAMQKGAVARPATSTSPPSSYPGTSVSPNPASAQPGFNTFPAFGQTAPIPRSGLGPPSAGPTEAPVLFPILSTTVYDHQGNITTIEFINSMTNSRLSDMTFTFSVPPGVQVIKPSEQNLPR